MGLGAAALVLLFVMLWMVIRPLRREVADLRTQLKALEQTNESLQKQMATLEGR